MRKFFTGGRPGLALAIIIIGLLTIGIIQSITLSNLKIQLRTVKESNQNINGHLDCVTKYFARPDFQKRHIVYKNNVCHIVPNKHPKESTDFSLGKSPQVPLSPVVSGGATPSPKDLTTIHPTTKSPSSQSLPYSQSYPSQPSFSPERSNAVRQVLDFLSKSILKL